MKKALLVIGLLIISLSTIYSILSLNLNSCVIYSDEPIIHYEKLELTTWWISGPQQPELINEAYKSARNRLVEIYLIHNDIVIENNLVSIYVNPFNNTIFVGLSTESKFIQLYILNIMKPETNVTVIFKKGLFPLAKLEKYEEILLSFKNLLNENHVTPGIISKTVNGTIVMSVGNLNSDKIDTIKKILKDKFPLNALEIWESTDAVLQ